MANQPKGMLTPVLVILVVIGFIFAFSVNAQVSKYKKLFEKEMAFRLDIEEEVNNLRSEKMGLTTALKDNVLEIQKKDGLINNLNQAISKAISEKDAEISNLQLELQKSNLLKQSLEERLASELTEQETEISQ